MYALLLAGGGGTRLWPLSTVPHPKQFIQLEGEDYSLFQNTVRRCLQFTDEAHILVLTGQTYRTQIQEQLEQLGVTLPAENILYESVARGTLPALMLGVREVSRRGGGVIAALPCDHSIGKPEVLTAAILQAEKLAKQYLVTFGILPDRPETGYGYIKRGEAVGCGFQVQKFCEKPDYETAKQYLREGYFWNSGIFLFDSALFLQETAAYCPPVSEAFACMPPDQALEACPVISFDVGVLEQSRHVAVLPVNPEWSDLGGFTALHRHYKELADLDGNVLLGNSRQIDCRDCLVYPAESKISIVGLSNVIVAEKNGHIFISSPEGLSKIKQLSENR